MNNNILILSKSDNRGDGIAAYNLAKMLMELKYNVVLLVSEKTREDAFILQAFHEVIERKQPKIVSRIIKKIITKIFPKPKIEAPVITIDSKYDFFLDQELETYFSADSILKSVPFIPDLIVTGTPLFLVNTTTLSKLKEKTNCDIYMVTMDMFPLTGGCCHAWDCKGFETDCSNCPAIIEDQHKYIAKRNLLIKRENIKKANIKVIVGSGRLLEQAKKSTLFKDQQIIYNINSFIDLKIFNNQHRNVAKSLFDIEENKKVIFVGAEYINNERKGFRYFIECLNHLWSIAGNDLRENVVIMIAFKNSEQSKEIIHIPFKKHAVKFFTDERLLSLAFQASDVFVCPSVEDPGPLMVSQALACGTPVVGFHMGVLSNMVINGVNGYKAPLRNSINMAEGLLDILKLSNEQSDEYAINAIKQVQEFSSIRTVKETFDNIMNHNN